MALDFLSDCIQTFVLPPGIFVVLAAIGLCWRKQTHCLGKIFVVIAFLSLYLLSMPFVGQLLINGLQNQYPTFVLDNRVAPKKTSAIVILGGGASRAPEYQNIYVPSETTFNRLRYGAFLYQKTNLPIIVSGGGHQLSSFNEADVMFQVLKNDFKVPLLWKENKSINTTEEGKAIMPLLKQHKIVNIYLVTNAWHMVRSVQAFHQAGLNIIPVPMGYISLISRQSILNYLPSINALNTSTIAIHEYIGLLWSHFHS